MKVYHIDVTARAIRVLDYTGIADLHRLVGGYISLAATFDNGDVIYVDDEGMFKAQTGFFTVRGAEQPFAGNGVMLGREIHPSKADTADPETSTAELTALVTFMSRAEAEAWAQANDSKPSTLFTSIGQDGTSETTVIHTWGQLFREMPKPPGSGS